MKTEFNSEIELRAAKVLEMQPSPAAHLRLLRDVLKVSADQREVRALAKRVDESGHVDLLAKEQRADGGWGAFHSRDTSSEQRIATTEFAVERAINLGLVRVHPLLVRAKEYILSIMRRELRFPDRPERNDRWATGMRLFMASTLSLIDPWHEILESDRALWREIAVRTFQSGRYSEEDEIQAHASLTGASVKGSYLRINNRYALNILGSRSDLLPPVIEEALIEWLFGLDQGIGYLSVPLAKEPALSRPGSLDRWLASLEMVVRLFPRSVRLAARQVEWIWARQGGDGLWDFGSRPPSSTFLPLADDWRHRRHRKIDWSTRVLLLAAACSQA